MRKAWITLVVFGILLCMVASLGFSAGTAQEEGISILAVSGGHLEEEYIGLLKGANENTYVIDVTGGQSETDHAGYDVVFMGAEPDTVDEAQTMAMTEATGPVTGSVTGPVGEDEEPAYEALYAGQSTTFRAVLASGVEQIVTLIGVDGDMDAETIRQLMSESDGHVIAIGAPEAAKAVSEAGVTMFLTADAAEDEELAEELAVVDLKDGESGKTIALIGCDDSDQLTIVSMS